MPIAPPRPCRWPGCPALVHEPRERFCAPHRRAHKRDADRRTDERRPSSARRGYGRTWRELRKAVLASQPLCELCLREGRITPATDVDHIVPLRDGGTNDPDNLRPLCRPHHASRHLREGKGRVWSR